MLPLNADGDTVAGMSNRRIFNLSCFFGVIVCALFLAPLAALRAMVPLVPCSSHNYGFKANPSGGGQGAAGFVARRQRMHPYAVLLASRPQPLGPPSTRNYGRNRALMTRDGRMRSEVLEIGDARRLVPARGGGRIATWKRIMPQLWRRFLYFVTAVPILLASRCASGYNFQHG